jgi:hypothetical protein
MIIAAIFKAIRNWLNGRKAQDGQGAPSPVGSERID